MKLLFGITFQIFMMTLHAQFKLQGEYVFNRQEMVAAFEFSADKTFTFFYSYGAVDRTASGTFSVAGDTLKLVSIKEPGKDFTIKKQSTAGKGYSLRFEDKNKYLLTHIRCIF